MIDTGAADNFISTALLQEQPLNIQTGPAVTIQLADGSTTEATNTCRICLKFTQDTVVHYTTTVRCRLVPLASANQIILGEPWLQRHQAVLSYAEHCLYVANKKIFTNLSPNHRLLSHRQLGKYCDIAEPNSVWGLIRIHSLTKKDPTNEETLLYQQF